MSEKDQTFLAVVEVLTAFEGQIDDIQIWNVALDSSQVLMSSSLVRLDTSIPTLASVTLSTSNNSQNLAKPGDNLTLISRFRKTFSTHGESCRTRCDSIQQ